MTNINLDNDEVLFDLLKGKKKPAKITESPRAKSFSLLSPDGIVYTGKNIREFGRRHNLFHSNISRVLSGKRKQYKGWRKA